MAWRMRDYLHQVESALRESGTVQAEGGVPPMLSVVVHNGDRPWRVAAECAGPLTGDEAPAQVRMYATVDLQALARGPDGEGRELAPGGRLATLAELESVPAESLPRLLLAAFERHDGEESAALRRGLAEGVERGLAQGRVALLSRQVGWRFGADVASQVTMLLADVTDVARLDEAGKWLLECDTGEALLARLRAGGGGTGNGAASG